MLSINIRRTSPSPGVTVSGPKHWEPPKPPAPPTPTKPPPIPPPAPPASPAPPPPPVVPWATSGWPNGVYLRGEGGSPVVSGRYKNMIRGGEVFSAGPVLDQRYCIRGRFIDPRGVEHMPAENFDRCTEIRSGTAQDYYYALTAQITGKWTFVATVLGEGNRILSTKAWDIVVS